MEKLKGLLRYAYRFSPLFREKLLGVDIEGLSAAEAFGERVPLLKLEELVEKKVKSGDPYSLRLSRRRRPCLFLQLEYDAGTPLYLALGRGELKTYAGALRRCWEFLGLGKGDRVSIYDYGTSPVAFMASSLFIPYLARGGGAGDALGCLCNCNDGLPEMAERAVFISRYFRPKVLFIRRDCLHPFLGEVARQGMALKEYVGKLVVEGNEEAFPEGERSGIEGRTGVPVSRLLRVDQAMFFAMECSECGFLHTWDDLYHLEVVDVATLKPLAPGQDGWLVITNLFARTSPAIRYLSQVRASLEPGACPGGRAGVRFRLC